MAEKTEINFEDLVIKNEENLQNLEMENFTFEDLIKTDEKEVEPEKENTPPDTEEKEVVVIAPKEEAPKNDIPPVETPGYVSIAKKLLEKGDWKDALIEIEEGKEVKLSEIENLDEQTFLSIWENQKSFSKEEFEKDYVNVKDIDENKLKIINILKEGGDLKEIFKDESQMVRPYEKANLDDIPTQQNILYNQYLRQNLSPEDAKDLVIKATQNQTLDEKSKEVVTHFQKQYDENLSNIEKQTREERIKEQERIKEYKKNLKTLYKEEGIEDNLSRTLSDAATQIDKESGQLYIDTVYEKLMSDPKSAKDLVFFMLENEKFLAKKGASIKRDANIETLKKIKIVADTSKVSNQQKETEEKTSTDMFSNLEIQ